MKRLKRFNETQDQDLQIIKEHFYNITEDLEDICTVEFQKNIIRIMLNRTDYEYIIYFRLKNARRKEITQNNLEEIDNWFKTNSEDRILLKEISASLSTLQDEKILDNFKLSTISLSNQESAIAYILKIYTKKLEN